MENFVTIDMHLTGDADAEGGARKSAHISEDKDFWIGRGADCDWVLNDPDNRISRRHCVLRLINGALVLEDHSSNGVAVAHKGARLVRGQPTPIKEATRLYLAQSDICIEIHYSDSAGPAPFAQPKGVFPVEAVEKRRSGGAPQDHGDIRSNAHPDPLGLAAAAARPKGGDPFDQPRASEADPLGLNKPLGDAGLAPDRNPSPPPRPRPQPQPQVRDPFGGAPQAPAQTGPADPFTSAQPTPRPEPIAEPKPAPPAQEPFGGGGAMHDPFGGGPSTPPPKPTPPQAPANPDPLNLNPPPAEEPAWRPPEPPPSADGDPLGLNKEPQAPEQAAPPVQPAPAPRATATADAPFDALLAELFLDPAAVPPEQREAMARRIGESYRAMAETLRLLLASRADVKLALGLGATQVQMGGNPLKFVGRQEDAVHALLQTENTGFLQGSEAVLDAQEALQRHQVTLVKGMRAAIKIALDAFRPETIEAKSKMEQGALRRTLSPKAALWDSFVDSYEDFADQADSDIKEMLKIELEKLHTEQGRRG